MLRLSQNREGSSETRTKSCAPKPKLPKFNEEQDNIDIHLERFERYATTNDWPLSDWVVNLSPLLTGKALEAYINLSEEQENYDAVKAILLRFMLTEEGYRLKFRDTVPEKGETIVQCSARIGRYFDRWVELAGIKKTYEDVRDLILGEQFLRKCHHELRMI